jgi:fatty-acyl-CoA synthase
MFCGLFVSKNQSSMGVERIQWPTHVADDRDPFVVRQVERRHQRDPVPLGVKPAHVRGYITPGYFLTPELDAEAFDLEGYFLTGDLGSIEADGRVRFRGRLKEMIKTGVINVAPRPTS